MSSFLTEDHTGEECRYSCYRCGQDGTPLETDSLVLIQNHQRITHHFYMDRVENVAHLWVDPVTGKSWEE